MPDAHIRLMTPDEAEPVSRLIVAAIRAAMPARYPAGVVDGLAEGNDAAAVAGHGPKQIDIVYEQAGRIVGMIGLKRNEIGHLFVDPAAAGRGIGRAMVEFAAEQFRGAGFADMIVLASLNAVGFYQRCGFAAEGVGSFPVGDGLPLVWVKMRAKL